MMVAILHFTGTFRVQCRLISLPRIDMLLDDPEIRYFVATEQRTKPLMNLRIGARHRGPRPETVELAKALKE